MGAARFCDIWRTRNHIRSAWCEARSKGSRKRRQVHSWIPRYHSLGKCQGRKQFVTTQGFGSTGALSSSSPAPTAPRIPPARRSK